MQISCYIGGFYSYNWEFAQQSDMLATSSMNIKVDNILVPFTCQPRFVRWNFLHHPHDCHSIPSFISHSHNHPPYPHHHADKNAIPNPPPSKSIFHAIEFSENPPWLEIVKLNLRACGHDQIYACPDRYHR